MPGNYTFEEYLSLIKQAESAEELRLLDEQLQEDRKADLIDVFEYIDIKTSWVIRLTDLKLDGKEEMR